MDLKLGFPTYNFVLYPKVLVLIWFEMCRLHIKE